MIGRIALGAGAAAAAVAGVGWAIARRLTAPVGPRMFDLTVRGVEYTDDGDLIVLDRTDQTTADGIYNLWFERGGWAQLSPRDCRSGTYSRRSQDHRHCTCPDPEGWRRCLVER
uniref:hypothetical protein n=1 Tax=Luteococcus sp. TaxID=1969402 RepID=UPI0037356830